MIPFFEDQEFKLKRLEEEDHKEKLIKLVDMLEEESGVMKQAAAKLRKLLEEYDQKKIDPEKHITEIITEEKLLDAIRRKLSHDFHGEKKLLIKCQQIDGILRENLGAIAEDVIYLRELLEANRGGFGSGGVRGRIAKILRATESLRSEDGLHDLIRTEIMFLLCEDLNVDNNGPQDRFAHEIMELLDIKEVKVPLNERRMDTATETLYSEEKSPEPNVKRGTVIRVAKRGIIYQGQLLAKARVITAS